MDLEQLTKHQIVLLTLLVSFVTSIATGIVTVSLMSQAPPSVSRTINQIVERTVQTVSAPEAATPVVSTVEQKTVVVQSDALAQSAIANVQKAIIRIAGKGSDQLVARGVIIDAKGTALTDAAAIQNADTTSFDAILSDGERVPVTIPKIQGTSTPILTIAVAVGTSTGFAPAPLADPSKLGLGQSVIRIGGVGVDTAGEGIVAALPQSSTRDIEASVNSSTPGSVLVDLMGEIIALSTTDSQSLGSDFYTLLSGASTQTAAASSTSATQ